MLTSGSRIFVRAAALVAALALLPTAALTQDDPAEKAIEARQGFMQVISWEAGPLFGMAKGDIAYNAETAADNAERRSPSISSRCRRARAGGRSERRPQMR